MARTSIVEAIIGVNEDNAGWLRALTGRAKEKPVVILDKSPTSISLKVGGLPYVITRTTDIKNPRTKEFSYLWTARTAKGQGLGIEHSDPREVIKALQKR